LVNTDHSFVDRSTSKLSKAGKVPLAVPTIVLYTQALLAPYLRQ
jgi:hypothetical protein